MITPAFNPRYRPTAIVVDDFFANPDEVRRFALAQEFAADNRYFRGQRSLKRFLWPGLKERFERLIGLKIKPTWESHATNGVFQFCVGGDQLVYHSDENNYAAAIYLTPDAPPQCGTSIIRSKATKGRTVEESARAGNLTTQAASKSMYEGKLLDKTAWDVIDNLGNVFNRLVLWDAKMTHCASEYFGHSKETGRLFQMFFMDCEI